MKVVRVLDIVDETTIKLMPVDTFDDNCNLVGIFI